MSVKEESTGAERSGGLQKKQRNTTPYARVQGRGAGGSCRPRVWLRSSEAEALQEQTREVGVRMRRVRLCWERAGIRQRLLSIHVLLQFEQGRGLSLKTTHHTTRAPHHQ